MCLKIKSKKEGDRNFFYVPFLLSFKKRCLGTFTSLEMVGACCIKGEKLASQLCFKCCQIASGLERPYEWMPSKMVTPADPKEMPSGVFWNTSSSSMVDEMWEWTPWCPRTLGWGLSRALKVIINSELSWKEMNSLLLFWEENTLFYVLKTFLCFPSKQGPQGMCVLWVKYC